MSVAAAALAGCAPAAPVRGGACATPREFASGLVCCGGQWTGCSDCAGGPSHDGGMPEGGFPDASFACADEGATGCRDAFVAVCRGGEWQTTTPSQLCFAPGCG